MSIMRMRRFLEDERGTTMTEFVMTLPIFITCFVGVLQLGLFNEKSVKTWARAHRNTFQLAILPSRIQMAPLHMQPTVGAATAAATYALGGKPIHQTGVQFGVAMASEASTYGAMALRGHWGESSLRTLPADALMDMAYVEGERTWDSKDIIGDATYTKTLVDERIGNFSGGGGSALGILNAAISGTGLRPGIAAGMRYGAVGAFANDSITVSGRTISTHAHFNCLVPPFPLKDWQAQIVPTAVARLAMEGTDSYTDLLGIAWSQPYPGDSLNVPDFDQFVLGKDNWPPR